MLGLLFPVLGRHDAEQRDADEPDAAAAAAAGDELPARLDQRPGLDDQRVRLAAAAAADVNEPSELCQQPVPPGKATSFCGKDSFDQLILEHLRYVSRD